MKKNNQRILVGMMSAVLACQAILPVLAVENKDKNQVEEEKNQQEEKLSQVNQNIGDLKTAKEELVDTVTQLDTQLNSLTEKLALLDEEVILKEEDIKKTKKKLKKAKKTEASQYEAMKKRIRYMYENGDYAAIEIVMSSKSIADFLNNAEYVSKITEYDRSMLKQYEETKKQIAKKEELLQVEYAESKALQEEAKEQEAQVLAVVEDKKQQIDQYAAQITSQELLASEYEGEIEAQNAVLAQIRAAEEAVIAAAAQEAAEAEQKAAEAQRKAEEAAAAQAAAQAASDEEARVTAQAEADRLQQEANEAESQANEAASSSSGSPSSGGGSHSGGFVWPCPSSSAISSDYGNRESPTAGASSNHQGIDISAPTGAGIVAAASGTVVTASYSSSAGNYVIISHGSGISTVYMHASALYVSTGQWVNAGESIAAVGSTGYSTGPHLHFGVAVNGSYVSPWNYL